MNDAASIQSALDNKTKPPGSLGELERVASTLCRLQGTLTPTVDPARVVIFAADHGVVSEGVSAFPASVTAQMMANFAAGGGGGVRVRAQRGCVGRCDRCGCR